MACLVLVAILAANGQTQKMEQRVSEEAEAFRRIAPSVLGRETLHQRALKPPPRFHPRVGAAAAKAPPPAWKDRDIISEYGFAAMDGAPDALHELRQVVSVDGRKVEDTKKAQDTLAKMITTSDDARKREALQQFEKYGLAGAVTDFGELILLFTRREMERYEFTARGARMLGDTSALVFAYKQLDGPEALTIIDAKRKDQFRRLRLEGEIWARADDFVPVRITVAGTEIEGQDPVREEASVDYAMSRFGALLPVSTVHRELRSGTVIMENRFTYREFQKFGASSDIKFDPQP